MDYSIDFQDIIMKITSIIKLFINPLCKPIISFLAIVFMTSSLQWILSYIYSSHCVDLSFHGFIKHSFNLASPFCQCINFVQFELSKNYINIWLTAGVSIIAFITSNLFYSSSNRSSSSNSDSSVSE